MDTSLSFAPAGQMLNPSSLGSTTLTFNSPTSASYQSYPTRSADTFVDSIGIHTATNTYQNSASDFSDYLDFNGEYSPSFFSQVMQSRLQELGVRHFRHFWSPCYSSDCSANPPATTLKTNLNTLASQGIHMDVALSNLGSSTQNTDAVAAGIANMGSVVETAEGLNEYDNHRTTPTDPPSSWVPHMQEYCQKYYVSLKNNPQTRNLPVIGPTFTGASNADGSNYFSVDLGDLSSCADIGGVHFYYPPQSGTTISKAWDYFIKPYPGKDIMVTETGFNTSTDTSRATTVTPAIQAKLILRQLLDMYTTRVKRTYIYDLIDLANQPTNSESNYGLLYHNNTPKPAFTALKNLITLLKEPGATVAEDTVSFNLSGPSTSMNTPLVLKKSDGTLYLVLYQRADSAHYPPAPKTVTIDFPSAISSVKVYEPTMSDAPSATYVDTNSITVQVPDDPIIVVMKP